MKKLHIAIIGAGKVASSLTPALINAGFDVDCIISANINSARTLALKNKIKIYSNDYAKVPVICNLFLICVPDREIKNAARKISKLRLNFNNSIFVHTSGAEDIFTLNKVNSKNGGTASFYIMQTFPSKRIVNIYGCYVAIETQKNEIFKLLKELALKLGMIPFKIDTNQKPLYHLAAVFASNFLVGNLFLSQILFENSVNKNNNFNFIDVIEPILRSTIKNIKKTGVINSLSGPVERGDYKTVMKHLSVLEKLRSKNKNKDLYNSLYRSYLNQSLVLTCMAEEKHK